MNLPKSQCKELPGRIHASRSPEERNQKETLLVYQDPVFKVMLLVYQDPARTLHLLER